MVYLKMVTFLQIEEVALVTEKGKGKEEKKKRRGFCFVTFIKDDDADKACNSPFHKINESEVLYIHFIN